MNGYKNECRYRNYDYEIVLMHCFITTLKVYKCYSSATRIRTFSHTNLSRVNSSTPFYHKLLCHKMNEWKTNKKHEAVQHQNNFNFNI